MPSVILQPCANKDSMKHYRDTIERPVKLHLISSRLSQLDTDRLSELHVDGQLRVWGVIPGNGVNVVKWRRIEGGDIVLFSKKGRVVFASGEVSYKVHNPDLARALWGRDSKGNTREYIYFLGPIKKQHISVVEINKAAGYKEGANIQGFSVLDIEKSKAVIAALGLENHRSDNKISVHSRGDDVNLFRDGQPWKDEEILAAARAYPESTASVTALKEDAETPQSAALQLSEQGIEKFDKHSVQEVEDFQSGATEHVSVGDKKTDRKIDTVFVMMIIFGLISLGFLSYILFSINN